MNRSFRDPAGADSPSDGAERAGDGIRELLDGKLGRKHRRIAGRVAGLCGLLDASGWGVAFQDTPDGPARLGRLAREHLGHGAASTGIEMRWGELCAKIPPDKVVASAPGLMVWRISSGIRTCEQMTCRLSAREREVLHWLR
jgi:hypothetical protein